MSDHARLSLSHANTWMVCAAWPRMVADMPQEESPEIEFGNVSHEILCGMLMGIAPPETPADETECAKVAYDYAQKVWEELGYDRATLMPEYPVTLAETGRKDLWGTADIIIHTPEFLEVIDLKTGAGTYVNESTSAQLKLYALAAMETLGLTPDNVRLTIVQPRYWGAKETIRSIDTNPTALREWLSMAVLPAAVRTDAPDAKGTAAVHCKQCVGRHVCEYRDQAVAQALTTDQADFQGTGEDIILKSTMEVTETMIRDSQDVTIYDNARLSQVLLLVPVIRDYCDALEDHAKEIIMKGEPVDSFKVVATQGVPTWVGDTEDLLTTLNKSRLKTEDYMKSKLRTPKQVAALKVGAAHDKPLSKALAKAIADHTGRTPGGLILTLEGDPRESAAPVFQKLTPAADPKPPVPDLPSFLM